MIEVVYRTRTGDWSTITGTDRGEDTYVNPQGRTVKCRNVGGQLVPLFRILGVRSVEKLP